jgi:DNA-directed RNA polymerase specialized sigma24 family protein
VDNEQKRQKLEEYASNNMAKLRKISYPLFVKFGGISEKDHDDFYSKANMELWKATEVFDDTNSVPFEAYLLGCLKRKFMTEMTGLNREKRKGDRLSSSLDAPIGENEGATLGDILTSNFNLEDEAINKMESLTSENTQKYLKSLSVKQRQIAEMIMDGYKPFEIKEKLGLTENQYIGNIKDMKIFEKAIILKQTDFVQIEEEETMNDNYTQTLEKSKSNRMSIASILKKIDNRTIRFDHPLQRASEQWSPAMKGNLISDILQGNPIPPLVFAEQIINKLAITWDLDGKQRCTNAHSFVNGNYKISKNIRRWNIIYQAQIIDNGNPVLDDNGFPMSERREFDIRGKRFVELPEELQDKFNEYNFDIVQYLNCSSEDIAYHIARYNEGKPMSASQKGITRLGEEFASMVKSISGMPFFRDLGGYKVSESNNGTVNRVVVESVMAANFIEDWKKKQEDMCEYMKDNATAECFDNFEDMVGRITNVGTEEVFNMFDSKDSFLYFGLFARFVNSGVNDDKFIEFMAEFSQSLHSKEIDGVTFDNLNGKSTKDKAVVVSKINHLELLMNDYLHIKKIKETENEVINTSTDYMDNLSKSDFVKACGANTKSDICKAAIQSLEFVRENIGSEKTEEDVELYLSIFDEWTLDIDNTSKLINLDNLPSLIGIVGYACDLECDDIAQSWFVEFAKKNSTYNVEQKENYLHMKDDLDGFTQLIKKRAV